MTVAELDHRVQDLVGKTGKLLIDGEWVEGASGRTFETFNPATEESLGSVAHGAAEDIDRAVRAARRCFDDERSDWRRMTPSERGKVIHRIGDLIERHADELAMLETLDNGKPLTVAKAADVALAADLFHYMSGWATKIEGNTVPFSHVTSPGSEFLAYTRKEPVGVVGQIIPWNFPLLMAAWKLGPALAAGVTVVLKPAEQTPLSALRLGELMLEAGLPAGVVNIVTGFGDAGAALAAHDAVDKVAFTGSTEVGRLIVQAAVGNLKKVTLELGGKSPQVLYKDADMDVAIPGAANGIFFNQGQCCNAGSRLYIERDVFDDVVQGISDEAKKITVGPGIDPDTQMGPLTSEEQRDKVLGYMSSGLDARGPRIGRRRPGGRPRVLRRADRAHRHHARHEGRARGDLRTGGVRDPLQFGGGRGPQRQRDELRPGIGDLDARHQQGPPDRPPPARRHGVDQLLQRVRRRDAVRRLQGVGLGPRDGPPGARQLPRDQVRGRPARIAGRPCN